ncbi:uridine kinase family protein [Gemmiger formicilis]
MTPLATAAAPILQAAQLAAENGPALLAIDGRCGSGKSTLAEFLAGQLGCRVVHTDDFYLPLAARCANWQEQPGANIDFIRLRNEVLQPLLRGETALYNAYSCAAGAFLPSKPFAAAPLTILEGSYSLHPALQTALRCVCLLPARPMCRRRACGRERAYATQILCSGGSRWRKGILLPMIQPHAAILYWTRRRFLCNIVSGPMA